MDQWLPVETRRFIKRTFAWYEWSRCETIQARDTKWNLDVEKDTGVEAPLERRRHERFRQHLHLNLRHNMTVKDLCCEVKECTPKHSESELPGLKSAELQDVLPARLLVWRSHIPVSANYFKMSGKRVDARRQRRRCNVVLLRILTREHWNPSSSSTDVKPGTATDLENSADQMDEDTSLRTPATS